MAHVTPGAGFTKQSLAKMNLKYCFLTIGFVFQQYIAHILSLEGFLNPATGPGVKPGPHWWEASTLTTVPSLLPQWFLHHLPQ